MFLWYYCENLLYSGKNSCELHYMDIGSFVNTIKGLIPGLKNFSKVLNLREKNSTKELYSEDYMKVIGEMKLESSPVI